MRASGLVWFRVGGTWVDVLLPLLALWLQVNHLESESLKSAHL